MLVVMWLLTRLYQFEFRLKLSRLHEQPAGWPTAGMRHGILRTDVWTFGSGRVGWSTYADYDVWEKDSNLGWAVDCSMEEAWDYGIRRNRQYGSGWHGDEAFGFSLLRRNVGTIQMTNAGAYGVTEWSRQVQIPCYFLVPIMAVLPAIWVRGRRAAARQRLQNFNPCLKCGYDLRATPDRCPECGTVPTPTVRPKNPAE